ncbi:CubicO group peptidase (beta-lactamase class C family) [Paenibacillus anaericanus]|nr:CubicO group peptidase (beta-lactamase class C family) [Paenibacillus anaericanus]
MQLRDKGLIELNTPVRQYLPWFSTKNSTLSDQITVLHLLNHTSGLPGRLNVHDIDGFDPDHIAKQINRKLLDVQLIADPGESYEYTNMNYDLLELIIEKMTGTTYPTYLKENIFLPLEMNRSGVFEGNELPNTATGHRYIWGELTPFNESLSYATLGSAGLSTNAEDFGKYISFLIRDSQGMDNPVLETDSLKEMHSASAYDNSMGFGYGWDITSRTIEKKGGLPGFAANLIIFPTKSYGFALLSNSKQDVTDQINFNISRILEGDTVRVLSNDDFPKVSRVNMILLVISGLLAIIVLLLWVTTLVQMIRRKHSYSLRRPDLMRILVCWVLNGMLLIAVLAYIYLIIPFQSGVPSLYQLTTAPDTVRGLTLLGCMYTIFSISLGIQPFIHKGRSDKNETVMVLK